MSDLCILSGRFPKTKFPFVLNHYAYSRYHRCDYKHFCVPFDVDNPYLYKIKFILQELNNYDYVFWIDDDAAFFNFNFNLRDLSVDKNKELIICKGPIKTEITTFISSGQFLIKNTPSMKVLLEGILSTDFDLLRRNWKEEWGYFTGGDQDALVYLIHEMKLTDKIQILPSDMFNSRHDDVLAGCNVNLVHFTGVEYKKLLKLWIVKIKSRRHWSLIPSGVPLYSELASGELGFHAHLYNLFFSFVQYLYRRVRRYFKN